MNTKITKNESCPCCGCKDLKDFVNLDESNISSFLLYSKKQYGGLFDDWIDEINIGLKRCKSCNHIFYKEMPSEKMISSMYASSIRPKGSKDPSRRPDKRMIDEMKKFYQIVNKENPTLLDYGAGYGRWSEAASMVGFQVISFEPHSNRTKDSLNYKLITGFDDLTGYFDAIWFEQVMEHVINPKDSLEEIKRHMHSETILRLSVPNVLKGIKQETLKKEWPYNGLSEHLIAPFQHLHGFNQSSLQALIIDANLKNINSANLFKNDYQHTLRLNLGKYFSGVSTTKAYLALEG